MNADQPATVMTVRGPVPVTEMGLTLNHEHVLNDVSSWSHRTTSRGWDPEDLARRPVTEDILWDLRHDPAEERNVIDAPEYAEAVAAFRVRRGELGF